MAADGAPPFALGTFSRDGARFPGLVTGERVHDLRPALGPDATTRAVLEDWEESFDRLGALAAGDLGSGMPVADLRVEVPIDPPGQVLCAGANYRRHLAQMHFAFERRTGSELSDDELRAVSEAYVEELAAKGTPYVFPALAGSLSGAYDDLVLFGPGTDHDWELELAVVIGRPAWRVARERAMDHVAAYTISNDVSTRDVMHRPNFPMTDFMATKIRPTFFPTGPYLVPAAFVPDPHDLRVTLKVNGEVMQDESTADIIFGVDQLVAYASTLIVLRPGDLLLTGSPAGNAAHHGNRWLRPGDIMEGSITGLGVQRNVCVEESAFRPAGV
jgi:2-keto-4-pentenoate hydratase/2-oxohepta-3-ene-1,7-dioic acid hydratase in catechol pathway